MLILLYIAGILVIAAIAVVAAGRFRFGRKVGREAAGIARRAAEAGPHHIAPPERIEELPDPVRRYLRNAMPGGHAPIRMARLTQEGVFRTAIDQDWMPMEAAQYFTPNPPALLWHATVRPAPLFWIEVRDLYDRGRGNVRVKLLSTVPLADAQGPEIDGSSLLRYLAEMVWFPTAFLDDSRIAWEPVDASCARVTITDGALRGSLVCTFDEEGRMTRCSTDERFMMAGDRLSQERWTGHFRAYGEREGFRIPTEIEAEWNLAGGDFSYGRIRVTGIAYETWPYA
ncbi:MAG: hypothetical protein QCH35_05030 [Methanomicrobiaceae archaeon]|nr:hypothetical protein [Methanomicrobiaceae archaeon]